MKNLFKKKININNQNVFVQRGENNNYPNEVEVWRKTDNTNPPAWLSDKCKITNVKDDGSYNLETRVKDDGSYEYITPELIPIVKVKHNSDYICFGDLDKYNTNKLFSLTEKQFELLFKQK